MEDNGDATPEIRRPNDGASVAAALRRSTGSLHTGSPTRTLRITASEKTSRDNTPTPISLQDLSRRPRSNPRSRTPMRFESPLNIDALRAASPSPVPEEPRRSTIRPLVDSTAGRGTQGIGHSSQVTNSKAVRSSKQGKPSHRKIRRWNNEHFSGLAAEISASSPRGVITAEVLLKAQREAHLYRAVYDPKEHARSKEVSRFMQGTDMKMKREQFFEGEGPTLLPSPDLVDYQRRLGASQKVPRSAKDMLNRMDPRLRRLVVRAHRNSYAAAKVLEYFEELIMSSFVQDSITPTLNENWWNDLLLEAPSITRRKDSGRSSAQFYFPATSSTGGFHRLLLQAVCQFHGLMAVPKMERNFAVGDCVQAARTLWVKGVISCPSFRLAQAISDENEEDVCIKDDESMVIVSNDLSTLKLSDDESSDAGFVVVRAM